MLCLSTDLTTHALPLFKQAFYPVLKDMKMGGKGDGVKVFNAAKYGSVKVFIVVQERFLTLWRGFANGKAHSAERRRR